MSHIRYYIENEDTNIIISEVLMAVENGYDILLSGGGSARDWRFSGASRLSLA